MRVVGYLFSDDGKEDVAAQKKLLERYASSLGYVIDEFVLEAEAPKRQAFSLREQGARLLDILQSGDVLLCEKAQWMLASAQRGLELVERLRKMQVSLYCADLRENLSLPAERKLVVHEGGARLIHDLLEALAVCESGEHGETIRAAKRQMRREGKYLGGPVPFGWRVEGGYLVKDRQEQKIISRIRKLREDRWSYRDIAVKLDKTFKVQLSHEGIRKILKANRQQS